MNIRIWSSVTMARSSQEQFSTNGVMPMGSSWALSPLGNRRRMVTSKASMVNPEMSVSIWTGFSQWIRRSISYEQWRQVYNEIRPHSSLGGLSPLEFIEQLEEGRNTAEPLNVSGWIKGVRSPEMKESLNFEESVLERNSIPDIQSTSRYGIIH